MPRETLPNAYMPDLGHQFLRATGVECRAGRLQVISDKQRAAAAAVAVEATRDHEYGSAVSIGGHRSTARGLEPGFYVARDGAVRHVQDERGDIEQDASTLRASSAGLIQIGDKARAFMELRVDLLADWDARQERRLTGAAPSIGGF